MRQSAFVMVSMATLCFAGTAMADEVKPNPHPLRIGFGADLSVPSGAALGVVVNPKIDWLTVQASLTYNALALGGRLSVKLDPLALLPKVPVGVFADLQGGFAEQGTIPGHADLPPVGYDYLNFYGGLRLGKPGGFNWNFEVGPSYLVANTSNFQSVLSKNGSNNIKVSDPVIKMWITPTFSTGFSVVW